MATVDNERYLRHLWCLGEGGLLVFRGIVTREAAKCGQPFENTLLSNKARFQNIMKEQQQKLFPAPSTANADVETWDMSLLILVINRLFVSSLSPAEWSSITTIKDLRNNIQGHPTIISMGAIDYDTSQKRLEPALKQLASGINAHAATAINDIIKKTKSETIDIQMSFQHIQKTHEFKTSVLNELESKFREISSEITGCCSKLNDIKGNIDDVEKDGKKRHGEVKTTLDEMHMTAKSSQQDISEIKGNVDRLETNQKKHHEEIKDNLQRSHPEIAGLKSLTEENTSRTKRIEGRVEENTDRMKHMEDRDEENTDRMKRLEGRVEELTDITKRMEGRDKENTDRMKRLEEMLSVLLAKTKGQEKESPHDLEFETVMHIDADTPENISEAQTTIKETANVILYERKRTRLESPQDKDIIDAKKANDHRNKDLAETLQEIINVLSKHGSIEHIKDGSIKITVRVRFYEGLLNIIKYFNSQKLKQCLNDMCKALKMRSGHTVTISYHISDGSLHYLYNYLEEVSNNFDNDELGSMSLMDGSDHKKTAEESELDMSDLEDPLYKNWVRSALSLKYLKQGIHSFVDRKVKQHHTDLCSYIKGTGCAAKSCSECSSKNLLPDHPRNRCIQKFRSKCFCNNPDGRRKCPNNFCSRFYDLIVLAHDERNPIWANTDPARWFGDHWALAQCFLGTTGYSDKHTAVETDASGLLSIMLDNIEIRNNLDCPDNVLKARDIRNEIMHSTSFEVDDEKLSRYVDQMILVLQDTKELINDEDAQNAVVSLTKLKRNQIYISEEDVSEMRKEALSAPKDGIKQIENKTDEVMHRIEKKSKQVHENIDAHFHKKLREQDKRLDDKNIQTVNESDVDNEAIELTAEEKDLQNYLVDLYLRDYVKVDISPLSPEQEEDIEEVYVPIKAERIRPGPSQSIDQFKDLFESGKNKFNNIFITGDAGIGKTTFCRKLISAWCRFKSKCKYETCKTSAVFDDERCSRERENEDMGDDEYEMLQDLSYYDMYAESSASENEEMVEEDKRQNDAETMSKTEQQGTCAVSDGNDNSCTYTADQIELEKFDFLFFVSLQDTYQECSIEEMIKCQLCKEKCHIVCFSQIIENKPEKCLVILDGLDEWQAPLPLPTHPAVSKGLPLSSTTGSYAKITTCRPWKTEILRPKFTERDCEIKLIGIGEKGSRVLMENMMLKLSKSSTNDQTLLFLDKLEEKNIECLKFVPLLIKLLICIWFENGALVTSETAIYSSIINLMVLQAEEKYSENEQFRRMTAKVNTSACELSSCLNEFPKLVRYSRLFQSVSKFAFGMLFRRKCGSLLVFKPTAIEQYGLTEEEIYLCLHFGILNQKSVFRDSKISNTKSLSFYHKTFQDYFAAMYLSINGADTDFISEVCEFCSTITQFYEMLSVFMFLGEMNREVVYKILAKTSILSKFEVEVINHCLTVKSKHINLNVMELFMRANFHSIIFRSVDFETSLLKHLDQVHGLDILELHGVRMTHKGMKELLQSIPESENGIILKITCLTWNDDFEVLFNFPMTITLQNLRKIDITGTDISKIDLIIGNGNHSLESVKLNMTTVTDVGLCRLINSIKPTRNSFELTVDNITLQKSVDVSQDSECRLVKIVICDKSSRCGIVRVGFFKICTTNDPVIIKELTIKDTDLSDISISFHVSQTRIKLLEMSNVKITTETWFSVLHATSDEIFTTVLNDVDLIKG